MSEHESQHRHKDSEQKPNDPTENSKNKGSGFIEEHRDRKQSGLRFGHTEISTDENDEGQKSGNAASKGDASAGI